MRPLIRIATLLLVPLLVAPPVGLAQGWEGSFRQALKNGGALVEDAQGKILFEHRSQEPFIPASILKIATSACALNTLGPKVRFATDLFLTKDKKLAIKGYGDPFLTSEELSNLALELKQKGLRRVTGIIADPSHFAEQITIDGASSSNNPYDAINGALLANFNTIHFLKNPDGTIASAEPQTPLTPLAHAFAKRYPAGIRRVNLGKDLKRGTQYTGELLAALLKEEGVEVQGSVTVGVIPEKAKHYHRYQSSKQLAEIIRSLLEFSTNFMANQLFLVMGARKYKAPATLEKGRKAFRHCLENKIGWRGVPVFEGAGLSRNNKVSPRQMMHLLRHFEKYRELLPLEKGVFRAKTGTLTGVNTLAGYFNRDDGTTVRFVLMVNDAVPYSYKFRLAKQLYRGINGHPPSMPAKKQ